MGTLSGIHAEVTHLEYSRDGKMLLGVASDGMLGVWDAATLRLVKSVTSGGKAVHATFSPDSEWILADDGRLWNWRRTGRMLTIPTYEGAVGTSVFSPDSKFVAIASNQKTSPVLIFRLPSESTGKLAIVKRAENGLPVLAFSPNGNLFAMATLDNVVKLWERNKESPPRELLAHTDRINSIAFSPDGRWLVTAGKDAVARVWSTETGALATELRGHRSELQKVAFSADGSWVITQSAEPEVRVFDCAICGSGEQFYSRSRERETRIR